MKIFMTTGTYEFLVKIKEKHQEKKMVIMLNNDGALLLHETKDDTVFKQPRKFEVLSSSGRLEDTGFIVLNNFPVTDEGRPLFEYLFKNKAKLIEKEAGFKAIRVLRPLSSNTYVILTVWENDMAYQNWQNLKPYEEVDMQPKIFASTSYTKKYCIPE